MILETKEITFHINNRAYTVNIGSDLDGKVTHGIKKYLSLEKNIVIEDLLLAYLQKTQELIHIEKDIENQLYTLNNFNKTKLN